MRRVLVLFLLTFTKPWTIYATDSRLDSLWMVFGQAALQGDTAGWVNAGVGIAEAHFWREDPADSARMAARPLFHFARQTKNMDLKAVCYSTFAYYLVSKTAADSIRHYFSPLWHKTNNLEDKHLLGEMLFLAPYYGYDKSDFIQLTHTAVQTARQLNDPKKEASALLGLSIAYLDKNMYFEASESLEKALDLATEAGDGTLQADIRHNIGLLWIQIGDEEKAVELARKNEQYGWEAQDPYPIIFALFIQCDAAFNQQNYQLEERLARKILSISDSTRLLNNIGYGYFLLAQALLYQRQPDSAIYYGKQGALLSRQLAELKEQADCHYIVADAYFQKKELDSALHFGQLVLAYDTDQYTKILVQRLMANIFEARGDFQQAYLHRTAAEALLAAQTEEKNIASTLERILESENQHHQELQALAYANDLRILWLAAGLGFLVLLTISVGYWLRSTRRQNDKLLRLNSSLDRNNQALKRFAYLASHDLLEPIRVIGTTGTLLKRKLAQGSSEENLRSLGFIETSAATLHLLSKGIQTYVNSLLNTEPAQQWSAADLRMLLEKLRHLPGIPAPEALSWELPESLPPFSFPAKELDYILTELVGNGFKYNNGPHPEVHLRFSVQPGAILVQVSDNGPGIPEQYRETVFDPFVSLQNKTESQSAGLGLSLAKLLVEKHHGNISLSRPAESGLEIQFTIPA